MTDANPAMPSSAAVAVFDERPFFEQALVYGVQHGVLDQARLGTLCADAPKGIVQIARYFGSEFLRPDLEQARIILVHLVSLCLQDRCHGDLLSAALSLRDHSFLSHSKSGADLLKALIVMPQSTHFGMNERGDFANRHIPQLARWAMLGYAGYQVELARRTRVAQTVDAALWMAARWGMNADDLQDAEPDAEAVIRTALLLAATGRTEMPNWAAFEQMIVHVRKKSSARKSPLSIALPTHLPAEFGPVVTTVLQSVLDDWPKICDCKVSVHHLFDQTPAFTGRYFWKEDALSEVVLYDRTRATLWDKLTGGHWDDSTLLTLMLCVAAGMQPKALLTEKNAAMLIRKIRKHGLQYERVGQFIETHAPVHHRDDCDWLWRSFIDESVATLLSAFDTQLDEALSVLRRECNVSL